MCAANLYESVVERMRASTGTGKYIGWIPHNPTRNMEPFMVNRYLSIFFKIRHR
jgi:hypothetical protein